jgi:hypothetical protein
MLTMIAVLIALAAFAGAAYYGWHRWFRDSEVNLVADAMTFVGFGAEFLAYLDDPAITEAFSGAGIKPVWLIAFGIAVRFARRFRDESMAVSKPYEE